MADCSATGTTLDRVLTRRITSSIEATGTLKNLAGNVGTSATLRHSMPMSMMPIQAPDTLMLSPGPAVSSAGPVLASASSASVSSNMAVIPTGHHQQGDFRVVSNNAGAMVPMVPMHMQTNHRMMMHPMQAMQQQVQLQMKMQAQMQAMSVHQQQMKESLHQRNVPQEPLNSSKLEIELGGKVNSLEVTEEKVSQNFEDTWHEGIEDEWDRLAEQQVEWGKLAEQKSGHEGLTEGASIDQLAQAWAEAEETWAEEEAAEALNYEFKEKSRAVNSKNPMEDGMQFFRRGETRQAILCFEAELLERSENSDAWRMLGKCHAENDEDRRAIACFERAVENDPYSLDSLLALGVSYVNELSIDKALSNLKTWVQHNVKYADLEVVDDGYGDGSVLDDVQNLLLQALTSHPRDADVLEALGVCYNASRDYDGAVKCFRTAIEVRPNNYELWNKLGATLANSQRSDEALPAYNKAIDMKPRYARAWLNMAISHSNLQNYDDAVRCYLQTLSLNPEAVHCWSYLRIALTCLERWDLLPLISSQDIAAFREHYDFVIQL